MRRILLSLVGCLALVGAVAAPASAMRPATEDEASAAVRAFAVPVADDDCPVVWISSSDPSWALIESPSPTCESRPQYQAVWVAIKRSGRWNLRHFTSRQGMNERERCSGVERPPISIIREFELCKPWRPKRLPAKQVVLPLQLAIGEDKDMRSIRRADASIRCKNRRPFVLDCSIHWSRGDYEWKGTASVTSRPNGKGYGPFDVSWLVRKTSFRCLDRSERRKCSITYRGFKYGYEPFAF